MLFGPIGDAQGEPGEALVKVVGLSLLGWFDAGNAGNGEGAGRHVSGS